MVIRYSPKSPEPTVRHERKVADDAETAARKRKPGGGRKPSDDPKDLVTLRIPRSVIARYQALGDDWRARMAADLNRTD